MRKGYYIKSGVFGKKKKILFFDNASSSLCFSVTIYKTIAYLNMPHRGSGITLVRIMFLGRAIRMAKKEFNKTGFTKNLFTLKPYV